MKRETLFAIIVLLFFGFIIAISALYSDVPQKKSPDVTQEKAAAPAKPKYISPMDTIQHLPTFKKWIKEDIEEVRLINAKGINSISMVIARSKTYSTYTDLLMKARFISPEAAKLAKSLSAEIKKSQRINFPKFREKYADLAGELLWIDDISVHILGSRKDRIQFVGGYFASNRNIKTFNDGIQDILTTLRFKRVDYKWIPSEEGYTYFRINSRDDNDIITR